MPKVTFIDNDGAQRTLEVRSGISLMEAAVYEDVPGIVAECGGNRLCATCHVYIAQEWLSRLSPIEPGEEDLLASLAFERRTNSRLSCQVSVSDDLDGLVVTTPERQA
jgi:2Fe-2S ferredoxin